MKIDREPIKDLEEFELWVKTNPNGVILNSYPNGFSLHYANLQKATCSTFGRQGGNKVHYSKYCFESIEDFKKLSLPHRKIGTGCHVCKVKTIA